jgi:hypothetical protein
MARVWRPGQQKECIIYRLLCTGTIEEKIFQRQVTKLALSSSIVEQQNDDKPNFTSAELRDLFTLRLDTSSDTHDLLGCRCSATSVRIPVHLRSSSVSVSSLNKYEHCDDITKCEVCAIDYIHRQMPAPQANRVALRWDRMYTLSTQDKILASLDPSIVTFMLSIRTEAPPDDPAGGGGDVQVEETAAEAFVSAPTGASSSSSSSSTGDDDGEADE